MAIKTYGTMAVDWERRIDFDRLRRFQATLEAVQSRSDESADREVRVRTGIGGLQLRIGRCLFDSPEHRGHAHGCFAVVVPPAHERACPVLRDDAMVGVEARRGQPAETGQMRERRYPLRHQQARQRRTAGKPAEYSEELRTSEMSF